MEGGTELFAGLTCGLIDSYRVYVKEIIMAIDSGAITMDDFVRFYFLGKAESPKCCDFFGNYDAYIVSHDNKRDIEGFLVQQGFEPFKRKLKELAGKGVFSDDIRAYMEK